MSDVTYSKRSMLVVVYSWDFLASCQDFTCMLVDLHSGEFLLFPSFFSFLTLVVVVSIVEYLLNYRDSPVSAVFWSPANHTIGKTSFRRILGQSWKVKFYKVKLVKFKTFNFDIKFLWNWPFFHYKKIMRFKKSPQ